MSDLRETPSLPDVVEVPRLDAQKQLAPLEEIAWKLTRILLLIIVVIVLVLLIDWCLHSPPMLNLAGRTGDEAKEALSNYEKLSSMANERLSKAFDLVVVKAILPLFATCLGFLLGKRQ